MIYMKNPLSGVGDKVKTFARSSDMDAVSGALGAIAGVAAIPYTPQLTFLGKWATLSNVIYGIALIALGAWVKHDGLGYFFVGMGVVYLVDGLVRVFIPAVSNSTQFALAAEINTIYAPASNTYGGQLLYNG